MGQKVNPIGLRTALTKDWDSRWFAGKALFGEWLHEDLKIRKFIKEKFADVVATKNKGQIMKAVMAELKGKADGKVINQVVAKLCS